MFTRCLLLHRYELGRQPANTKLAPMTNNAVRKVRVRGGNTKFRALRLDAGNFSWGSEVQSLTASYQGSDQSCKSTRLTLSWLLQATTRKTRILAVNYNASNNELVRCPSADKLSPQRSQSCALDSLCPDAAGGVCEVRPEQQRDSCRSGRTRW